MIAIMKTLLFVLDIAWFIVIAHVIMSWLISFQVLNARQPLVAQIWYGLNRMLEPLYAPIRRVLPQTGGLDFTPLVAIIILYFLRTLIASNVYTFA